MYKLQYTPAEAQEQFRLIEESSVHAAHKERFRRYVENRIIASEESVEESSSAKL
jgi:hypothetical protein